MSEKIEITLQKVLQELLKAIHNFSTVHTDVASNAVLRLTQSYELLISTMGTPQRLRDDVINLRDDIVKLSLEIGAGYSLYRHLNPEKEHIPDDMSDRVRDRLYKRLDRLATMANELGKNKTKGE